MGIKEIEKEVKYSKTFREKQKIQNKIIKQERIRKKYKKVQKK